MNKNNSKSVLEKSNVIMNSKYPIDTLMLLKSNYKYKRRAASDTPYKQSKFKANFYQNVHKVFSIILKLFLIFINELVQPKLSDVNDNEGSSTGNYKYTYIDKLNSYQRRFHAKLTSAQRHCECKCTVLAGWLSNFSFLSVPIKMQTAAAAAAAAATTTALSTSLTSAAAAAQMSTSKRCSMSKLHKGISVNLLVMTLLIAWLSSMQSAEGGACWNSALDNGKCSKIFSMNITRQDCCRISEEFSYTDRELTSVEFFFATAIGGGMECAPCVDSCKSVKCGPNKKCVKRKGRPKCVCAPDCGAAKRRKQQQKILRQQEQQQQNKRYEAMQGQGNAATLFAKSPRDVRSLSSEINNYNLDLDLDELSTLVQKKQQQQQQRETQQHQQQDGQHVEQQNQRKLHILQSQSQQKPAFTQKQRRLVIMANVEPTTATTIATTKQRRLQILSNVEGSVGGKRGRNKHVDNGERRHVDVSKSSPWMETKSRSSMSRHYQTESNELPINSKQNHRQQHQQQQQQQQQQHNEKRRHRHHQKQHQKQNQTVNLRHVENAPNDNEDQNKQPFVAAPRKRKHKHNQQQQQQQQHQRQQQQHKHKQHKIKDHMLNNTRLTTKEMLISSSTLASSTTKSSSSAEPAEPAAAAAASFLPSSAGNTTNSSLLTTTNPANSTMSAIDKHLNVVNHGSSFATSSLSPLSASKSASAFATTATTTTTATTATTAASTTNERSILLLSGVDMQDNNNDQHAVVVDSAVSSNSVNTDDMTFLDGISDQYNLHGFPNQQYSIMHSEHFHGTHPVCGSDGRTYNTECQLKKRACRTNNANLQVAYRGYCKSSCNGVKCLHGLTCVEDNYQIPHCISCNIQCPRDDDLIKLYNNIANNNNNNNNKMNIIDETRAVCGVDGKTYKSTCDINRMICKIGRAIAVAYPGPCREDRITCHDINCGPKNTCLVDFLTHQPRCVSCRYKCSRKRRPMSLRYEEDKICGVNNRTYNSWCEMRKDSCSTGFFIDVKTAGECTNT